MRSRVPVPNAGCVGRRLVARCGNLSLRACGRILLFKGTNTEAQVAATITPEGQISEATVGYSIGIWHLLNGREAKAREYFERSAASK